ncbi:hypothetical protein ACTHAM_003043 [Cellulomonas soli]|uniref:hypothetical protein n=1 Tax=Cellulomonas soli TaxID=931535 RepID=UPI003F851210
MVPRAWGAGITDWAYLATSIHHELRVEYQLADVLARGCNMEFSVEADSIDEARQLFRCFYVSLLLHNTTPFFAPFISSHSINDFSAISAPPEPLTDSRAARSRALRNGDEHVLLAWNEAHLGSLHAPTEAPSTISHHAFEQAAAYSRDWAALVNNGGSVLVLQETLISAPQIPSHGQSIMPIWSGLESLFPQVSAELSFRLALYLAQMIQPEGDRRPEFERIRAAYGVRSRIAHGSRRRPGARSESEEWTDAWNLLTSVARAAAVRGGVPSEDALTGELLGGNASG